MDKLKVGIGMSGGVDSTATALLLKNHYDVTGYFMQLAQPNLEEQIEEVKSVCTRLDIPLKVINLTEQFEQKVLDYFRTSYFSGKTPNPCIICNKYIKFGLFLDTMLASGMDRVATGHYANIREQKGSYHLKKGHDAQKDQSYFLARLGQDQLGKIFFPLGEMKKEEVYNLVEKHGFTHFRGLESQDVCFIDDMGIGYFLQERQTRKNFSSGHIINMQGEILGKHKGIQYYTIGQRRGLGISDTTPYYVVQLDNVNNTVIVGKQDDLFKSTLTLKNIHWISGSAPNLDEPFIVKIRHSHKGSQAHCTTDDKNNLIVHFDEPQRAITPGQFGVLYRNNEVIGSGEIRGFTHIDEKG